MDQGSLVDVQIQDGRRVLERLRAEGVPVTAAAWVKESEGGPWYFYIVTPLVTEDGATPTAYRRLGPLIRGMPQPCWVNPMEFKVVAPDSEVGKAIRDGAGGRAGPIPMPYGSVRFGGVSIDGAYVYPLRNIRYETALDPKAKAWLQQPGRELLFAAHLPPGEFEWQQVGRKHLRLMRMVNGREQKSWCELRVADLGSDPFDEVLAQIAREFPRPDPAKGS